AQVEFAIPVLPSPPITKYSPIQNEMTVKLFRRIKNQISTDKLSQDIDVVEKGGDTLILRVKDTILFEPGETKISPESYPLLRHIADIIRPMPLLLRIEGHTDAVTETQVEMNRWDISMARSVSVMRFYTRGEFLPLDRMAAVGYGASHPLASNETVEGRAQNRRVDFVLRSNAAMDVNTPENSKNEIPF
ncbi:MAG TPA: OmpA family protein, partial [Desulfopila sp.]|nr:OmpA family protein [Desulfopila sp.]